MAGAEEAAWWFADAGSDKEVLTAGQVDLPASGPFPARRNARFADADRPLTAEVEAARYTNFYEFSSGKQVWRHVSSFAPVPWKLEITGLVAKPRILDL